MSKIIVRGLPWGVRDERLKTLFAGFGEITVRIQRIHGTFLIEFKTRIVR